MLVLVPIKHNDRDFKIDMRVYDLKKINTKHDILFIVIITCTCIMLLINFVPNFI